MKRLPLLATLVVAIAVAMMIGLGIWQLGRAEWKEGLIARYTANASRPPVAFPVVPMPDDRLLYRRATGFCLEVRDWSARSGHNLAGDSGWRHIALCRAGGAEGPGMAVDLGWSTDSKPPVGYRGGEVTGVIDRDRDRVYLLVADRAAPGLQPSARPSPASLPNNHRAYAVQWFLFALIAIVIYLLALRRRQNLAGPDARS